MITAPKRLRCIHCGHDVTAQTWDEADRLMVDHYAFAHPGRKYADPLEMRIDEAVRRGQVSLSDALSADLATDDEKKPKS